MRTLMLEIVDGSKPTLAFPTAEPGWVGNVRTYAITHVPDIEDAAQVIALFRKTVNLTWLFGDHTQPDEQRGRYKFRYSELWTGKLIRD